MSKIESKLIELGIELPEAPKPVANYIPAKRTGNLIYIAGQIPIKNGVIQKGKLGKDITLEESKNATKLCAIGCLAAIKTICPLDKVTSIVAMHGLVNSTSDNTEQADAMNGASDLIVQVFGEIGKHTRTAVGVSVPHNIAASVYMVVEIND
ncbi:enamine deaminase RidA (YjgF/YER057c/UK114 family) [Catalinimonas alkaloidigena]|uniref:RidA family protein n=1 Tax=Catalinimonas alkaloidigena TaxID=1075417 RepID=UPI0024076697|nr:RidA family protein [Catalinimonas alkaloidigena]MDF9800125.1 enamine deaminase RidA (YjgF/YER057c/UK114 family) [Catalinimonas alkaloidigena]